MSGKMWKLHTSKKVQKQNRGKEKKEREKETHTERDRVWQRK